MKHLLLITLLSTALHAQASEGPTLPTTEAAEATEEWILIREEPCQPRRPVHHVLVPSADGGQGQWMPLETSGCCLPALHMKLVGGCKAGKAPGGVDRLFGKDGQEPGKVLLQWRHEASPAPSSQ